MKNNKLNYGMIGRILLNADLLNNTNISKYLSQEIIDKLNSEYIKFVKAKNEGTLEDKGLIKFDVSSQETSARLSFSDCDCPFYQSAFLIVKMQNGKDIWVQSRYAALPDAKEIKWITIDCDGNRLYLSADNEFAKRGKMFKVLQKNRELKKSKDGPVILYSISEPSKS